MLAVANAVGLAALGVEQSQKRARQARNLDGLGLSASGALKGRSYIIQL